MPGIPHGTWDGRKIVLSHLSFLTILGPVRSHCIPQHNLEKSSGCSKLCHRNSSLGSGMHSGHTLGHISALLWKAPGERGAGSRWHRTGHCGFMTPGISLQQGTPRCPDRIALQLLWAVIGIASSQREGQVSGSAGTTLLESETCSVV